MSDKRRSKRGGGPLGGLLAWWRSGEQRGGNDRAAEAAPVARPDHGSLVGYVHPGAVHWMSVSPDGSTLAIGGAGRVDRERRRHQIYKENFDVVIESDVVLMDDPAALRGDDAGHTHLRMLSGHTGPVTEVVWEGETLWTAAADRTVRQFDLATGNTLAEAQLHNDAIYGLHPGLGGAISGEQREQQPAASADAPGEAPGQTAHEAEHSGEEHADWHESATEDEKHGHSHDHAHEHSDGDDEEDAGHTCSSATPARPEAAFAGYGATISADRTLRIWTRHDRRVATRQFISPAIILDALVLPDVELPGGAEPVYLATDQLFQIIGYAGLPTPGDDGKLVPPRKLTPILDTDPFYRLERAKSRGLAWAGHRLGKLVLIGIDDAGEKLVELARHDVFDGCRVPAIHEFARDGESWLAAGSLRGEVALVRLSDGEIMRCADTIPNRVRAMAWWCDKLIAADHKGFVYDLTAWCDSVTKSS